MTKDKARAILERHGRPFLSVDDVLCVVYTHGIVRMLWIKTPSNKQLYNIQQYDTNGCLPNSGNQRTGSARVVT